MNRSTYQTSVRLSARWLGLVMLLLLPLALAWAVGAAGSPALAPMGPAALRSAEICNLFGGNFPVTEAEIGRAHV